MSEYTVDKQIEEVLHLREEDPGYTFQEIGERLGFSERTARRRYEAGVLSRAVDHLVDEEIEDFPAVEKQEIKVDGPYITDFKQPIERFAPLVVTGDAMVICDLHIPLHDPVLINTMIHVARTHNITKLIIGGDYYHMETFSSYLPHQPEAALEIERYDGAYIMRTLLETFEEIVFIWGNHDFRLSRKLGFKKSFEECMKWMFSDLEDEELEKIRFSDLDYMYYFPEFATSESLFEGRKFRVCHPRNFSSVPLTVGRSLATKYNCSIITAHSHHCALGAAPNGKDLVIEGGGFFAKDRTEYIQRSTRNHEWVQGFTMFKDGLPTLFSPIIGNTEAYRKEVEYV